ncbi:MAG: glycosyltransferase family 2 protein [bacterium]
MKPLVSLITPVYNAMPYLADYLESVRNQTWRPMELILADDGSTDGSGTFLASECVKLERAGISVKLLELPHVSQAAAVNAALKVVSGELLTWCDADDVMLPECVEKKAAYLVSNPEIGMVRNDGLTIDVVNGNAVSRDSRESDRRTKDIFRDLFLQATYCYAGCYMVRMSLFDKCYPGREIPLSPEGQNLQLLLPPASRSVCGFIPDVLHYYYRRASGHSVSQKSYTQRRNRIRGFSILLGEILPFCTCDESFYREEIRRMEKEQIDRLNHAAATFARKEMGKR